jgi:hypothetical protein
MIASLSKVQNHFRLTISGQPFPAHHLWIAMAATSWLVDCSRLFQSFFWIIQTRFIWTG